MKTSNTNISFIFYNKFYFYINMTISKGRFFFKLSVCNVNKDKMDCGDNELCGFSPKGNQIQLLYLI